MKVHQNNGRKRKVRKKKDLNGVKVRKKRGRKPKDKNSELVRKVRKQVRVSRKICQKQLRLRKEFDTLLRSGNFDGPLFKHEMSRLTRL